MKSIAIVLPNLGGGGAERLHINLANYWSANGFYVEFVLMEESGILLNLLSPKVSIVSLNKKRMRNLIPSLVYYFYKQRPDIILSAMWPLTTVTTFAWLLNGAKGKLFLSDHNFLSISCVRELGLSSWLVKLSMRMTYHFVSGVIAVSYGVRNDLAKLSGLEKNKIKVIYNPIVGVNDVCSNIVNEDLKKEYNLHNQKIIITAGILESQKNYSDLIQAFSMLQNKQNIKLVILGEGSERLKLQKLINKLQLTNKILMPGFVKDPYSWFCLADLFVLSSKWEGFGNVIVEALMCKLPVVSYNCPSGPSEILSNGKYGILVPVGDIARLSLDIHTSLNTSHDKEKLLNRSRDFAIDKIANEYLKYFLK
jgi:glycosyltransferase involved in cell wall biosynthesis